MNDETLFTFNEFFIKMLALNMSDHENIKAILSEVAKFKTLAEQATELHKVFLQLEGYEDDKIKIHLGMEGTILWPAAEIQAKVNDRMTNAIMDLQAQERIIDKMAQAIGSEVAIKTETHDADMWLVDWKRDVRAFLDKHHWLPMQLNRSLLFYGKKLRRDMLKNSPDGPLPPDFSEELPTIVSGGVHVRSIGPVYRDDLKKALDNEGEEQE